jgi:hypothetical protein
MGKAVDALHRDHFTDEEIEKLLRRPWGQLSDARFAFRRSLFDVPTRWTCKAVDDAVIRFASETGAWPKDRDYLRRNGLASPGVFRYHDHPEHWCWGEWRALVKEHRAMMKDRTWPGGKPWPNIAVRRDPHPPFWERIVERAAELPAKAVLAIPNSTHRRDAVVNYGGFAKLAQDGAGRQIQQDDYGTLWRIDAAEPGSGDWHSMFVEVVNSTPRMVDDGSGTYVLDLVKGEPVYDHYFLRVPPHMSTARLAVAWTGHFEIPRGGTLARLGEKEFAGFAAQS